MKPITVHPVSVLIGLALAGVVAISTGAAQSVQPIPTRTLLVGEIPAEWWTYIQVRDGSPYAVPSDRSLVVTRATGYPFNLRKNGAPWDAELEPVLGNFSNFMNPWTDVGNTRVVAQPGTVLDGHANLWGYLEPVR